MANEILTRITETERECDIRISEASDAALKRAGEAKEEAEAIKLASEEKARAEAASIIATAEQQAREASKAALAGVEENKAAMRLAAMKNYASAVNAVAKRIAGES